MKALIGICIFILWVLALMKEGADADRVYGGNEDDSLGGLLEDDL